LPSRLVMLFLPDFNSRQDAPVHVLPGGGVRERPVGVSRDELTTLATGWPAIKKPIESKGNA
jgi:hypothetical protein